VKAPSDIPGLVLHAGAVVTAVGVVDVGAVLAVVVAPGVAAEEEADVVMILVAEADPDRPETAQNHEMYPNPPEAGPNHPGIDLGLHRIAPSNATGPYHETNPATDPNRAASLHVAAEYPPVPRENHGSVPSLDRRKSVAAHKLGDERGHCG